MVSVFPADSFWLFPSNPTVFSARFFGSRKPTVIYRGRVIPPVKQGAKVIVLDPCRIVFYLLGPKYWQPPKKWIVLRTRQINCEDDLLSFLRSIFYPVLLRVFNIKNICENKIRRATSTCSEQQTTSYKTATGQIRSRGYIVFFSRTKLSLLLYI